MAWEDEAHFPLPHSNTPLTAFSPPAAPAAAVIEEVEAGDHTELSTNEWVLVICAARDPEFSVQTALDDMHDATFEKVIWRFVARWWAAGLQSLPLVVCPRGVGNGTLDSLRAVSASNNYIPASLAQTGQC